MPTWCSSRPRPRHRPNQHALIGRSGGLLRADRRRNDAPTEPHESRQIRASAMSWSTAGNPTWPSAAAVTGTVAISHSGPLGW
jgi:hypothetical protein